MTIAIVRIYFFMIRKETIKNEKESILVKENYVLWRLMINKKYQNKGLGKKTIDATINLIRTFPFGETKMVWLSCEPENTRAKDIYIKYGFIETSERCGNKILAIYKL